jgi:hypothetical protein
MADKKVISIILNEARSIDQRCSGYRDEIIQAIGDILDYERQNRVQGTNIQQKINDKCNAVGRFLADKRGHTSSDEDGRE